MGRSLGITVKRVGLVGCLDGHVKGPYEMSMAWDSNCRSNFFFSPPAHLYAVTYITEISLNVTLSNQSTQLKDVFSNILVTYMNISI